MGIGELIEKSFIEYKKNFKDYLKILIFLYIIPFVIFIILTAAFFSEIFYFQKTNLDIVGYDSYSPLGSLNFFQVIFLILIFIALFFIQNFFTSSLVYYSLYKKDKSLSFKEILSGGKKYFWKFLGLNMLIFLLIIVLTLPLTITFIIIMLTSLSSLISLNSVMVLLIFLLFLLLIPILFLTIFYFSIKWIFSPFVLIGENKGIIESLKISSSMVKKRWWITFFYVFLFFIILMAIFMIILLILFIISFISLIIIKSNFIIGIIYNIIDVILLSLVMPLSIIFLKNFYLMRKNDIKNK
ncbi:MAG: hypothetical protein QXW97_02265 [Candidatus Pacearchaeota archaeon]